MSFVHQDRPAYGLVQDDHVVVLSAVLGERAPDLKALIAAGLLPQAAALAQTAGAPRVPLVGLTLLPVIPNPGQIFCIGLNYAEHVRETGREVTETPVVFMRVPASQVAHGQDIMRPPESVRLDFEAEIAVIIGKGGRRIREADAWDHIAGYSCYNDGSVRDWQRHTTQFTPGKNFVGTGAFGPVLVTRGEIADGEELSLTTRLNGQVMQHATTAMMIFPIPRLIEYVSTFTPLMPGDVIVSGTPGGVGSRRQPPLWMKEGDWVEIEVSKIGVLRNRVEKETL